MRAYLLRRGRSLGFRNEVARVLDHFESSALVEEVICEISPETASLLEKGVLDIEEFPREDRETIEKHLEALRKGEITVGWIPNV
ncbi:hypothetical protein [Thermococcus sp. 4557]|uniref:hypothetical protein n=1 Tax=Thermococcus sp. (strain CGMCC 1.5172 / 4557) TaxID=1042877 RepID=UPI00064FA3CF|nr:hypothetical protein [Thermococcus sp. 4557]